MSRPTTHMVIAREWIDMKERASGLGHRLGSPEQDTEVSLVAECIECELPFGVDGQEAPHQYSAGLSKVCQGVNERTRLNLTA